MTAFPSRHEAPSDGGVNASRLSSLPRWSALALVVLALLLRAGIPAGYMIGTGADGAAGLILCPGTADASDMAMAMPMAMPMTAPHGSHDAPMKSEMPCPFAAIALPALPAAPPILAIAGIPPMPAPAAAWLPTFLAPQAAAPPPPSTGPPAFA
jgi:hypothetical protein